MSLGSPLLLLLILSFLFYKLSLLILNYGITVIGLHCCIIPATYKIPHFSFGKIDLNAAVSVVCLV